MRIISAIGMRKHAAILGAAPGTPRLLLCIGPVSPGTPRQMQKNVKNMKM